jgi:uncharacterized protein YjbI with pentapeptide repeats
MELKTTWGEVIFALETAKTMAELIAAALAAKKSLYGADLSRADLSGANLYGADLSRADLSRANLYGANLYGANLSGANLSGADLSRAYLSGANLYGADLSGAKNIPLIAIARMQFIPAEGAFIGWKQCRDGAIVKLGISASAKRSHGTERKCRCSKAKTLAIFDSDGKPLTKAASLHDSSFIYEVGKVVTPANGFDDNRWNTCGSGIHFYITREEAEAHQ